MWEKENNKTICLIKDEKNNHKFILKISSWCKKEKRDETPEKNFHEYNYRNRDHIRKHIQPNEICILGETNHLYWKELSKIRPRREGPIRTRGYVKKEAPIIDFMTDQN